MSNCLQNRMLQTIVILNLMVLTTLGSLWQTRIRNVPKKFLQSTVNSNPHNYSLVLNTPDLCGGGKEEVFLLILIRAIPQNILRRRSIRETWGTVKEVGGKKVKIAFLFGENQPDWNKHLVEEQAIYHDIIQESFQESYVTLTLKTVMAWKWAITFCSQSTYVMVVNDEMFVDPFKTVPYLNGLFVAKKHRTLYGCYMEHEANPPNRNLKHKHGVPWAAYPGKKYPAFCNGNGYVASMQIIRKLYGMSLNTPSFMPDDAWTGVLAAKLSLVISNIQFRIPIATKYKIIEQYLSLDRYVKNAMLLYPLDRKFRSCEICVATYLWQQISLYNSYNRNVTETLGSEQTLEYKQTLENKQTLEYDPSLKQTLQVITKPFLSSVPISFYASFTFTISIIVLFYISRNKRFPIFLSVFNILILITTVIGWRVTDIIPITNT